jgi:hypothetical protein
MAKLPQASWLSRLNARLRIFAGGAYLTRERDVGSHCRR